MKQAIDISYEIRVIERKTMEGRNRKREKVNVMEFSRTFSAHHNKSIFLQLKIVHYNVKSISDEYGIRHLFVRIIIENKNSNPR